MVPAQGTDIDGSILLDDINDNAFMQLPIKSLFDERLNDLGAKAGCGSDRMTHIPRI